MSDAGETEIEAVLPECVEFIQGGGSCLVHCSLGVNRSPTVVVAYLMTTHQMSLRDAWRLVKAQRPKANPMLGYFEQLRMLEVKMFGGAPSLDASEAGIVL
eukprot:TRINITY_DN15190_c0_g1_i1.p1 TRINITY_DN15190_c0_g1~~TRINITY_DN15190_c0_g1_i1.p1  ORF type:complete len:101 (-),score=21.53 TRINITY_DN15190_c0_g1_i1:339-641(-)